MAETVRHNRHGTFDALDLLVRVDSNDEVVAQRARLQRLRVNIAEKDYWRRLKKGTWRNALAWPKWKRSKHPSTQLRESVTFFTRATAGGSTHTLICLFCWLSHITFAIRKSTTSRPYKRAITRRAIQFGSNSNECDLNAIENVNTEPSANLPRPATMRVENLRALLTKHARPCCGKQAPPAVQSCC